ncbi:IS110 family transposase [Streptomyces sp. NPDC005706]|uniref:IS110 family transposase n=1 Tax=Streptomyces sp. NPDC005706 TaxID=3157169 RepID=UPI0033C1203B
MAPELLDLLGVGPITATQILVSWSHPGRFRSQAAFASFGGVSSIPASPGLTNRHRLSRSGDRQLNGALHTTSLIRMRLGPTTKAYVARRVAEGRPLATHNAGSSQQSAKILERSDRDAGMNSENLAQAAGRDIAALEQPHRYEPRGPGKEAVPAWMDDLPKILGPTDTTPGGEPDATAHKPGS